MAASSQLCAKARERLALLHSWGPWEDLVTCRPHRRICLSSRERTHAQHALSSASTSLFQGTERRTGVAVAAVRSSPAIITGQERVPERLRFKRGTRVMGKGKTKGWRPSAQTAGLLCGSADHLSGDTVASPVQLREEGKPLPPSHFNYRDREWRAGRDSKASWNAVHWAAAPKEEESPRGTAPKEEHAAVATVSKEEDVDPPAGLKDEHVALAVSKEEHEGVSSPLAFAVDVKPVCAVEARLADATADLQDRRRAMLRREKERVKQEEEPDESGFEARRLALQRSRKLAETRAREALVCRETLGNSSENVAAGALKEEVGCQRDEGESSEAVTFDPYFCKEEVAESQCASAQLPCFETNSPSVSSANYSERADICVEEPAAKRARQSAIHMGLQRWAQSVNATAHGDEVLVKLCREFVRRRILQAVAAGKLHGCRLGRGTCAECGRDSRPRL